MSRTTIPLFEGKHRLASAYTPGNFLDHLRSLGWEPGAVPTTVINTFARLELFLAADRAYVPNHMLGTGPGRFFLIEATEQRVAINCLGTGAPVTATQLELQAELGVERFIHLGTAGGIQPNQSVGDVVVATLAVRDEGVSAHYVPPEVPALPCEPLTERLVESLAARGLNVTSGPIWTTGAPFRTTAEEVAYYARHGVLGVEEEIAALFVVGAARTVETAAAVVLDGVMGGDGGAQLDLLRAGDVLRACLSSVVEFAGSL